ncbi:hypothetical protein KVF89_25540 [Nocardioides carbamazepini]|uniref:hypothetical protein n=1 Tax=Nocardioides carbamazepini TaxID=2854259 RepID=UPI00214A0E12|nr:hypothetical protein [Nocardioides carbamazepini]MCR1785924.1 hypothetical protein [Nocardioides carbamazepini]
MPTFTHPADDAAEAQQALRGLAHATRIVSDSSDIYRVLGALTDGLGSLSQALHQLAGFHDRTPDQPDPTWPDATDGTRETRVVSFLSREDRAASCQVSWELHRAAEMVRQVCGVIGRAHEAESTITYPHIPHPTSGPRGIHRAAVSRPDVGPGLSL